MAIETSVKIKAVVEGLNKVDSQFRKLGQGFTKVGKSLSLGLTAPIAAFGVAGLSAFNKQAKAIAQVEAGLKSTGNAIGFTSQELQGLASDLQNNSLFGDEEILQGVTAQLLTFTSVAGEQFERTQLAALDLAARLDGDLKSSAIQLGKALNDPSKNLSLLSRAGIQFSDDQIKVIKQLQKTNKLADAQTLILNELEKQYGGSAKAAAEAGLGPFKQLQNSIGDLSEEFGGIIANAILPFVKSLQGLIKEFQGLSAPTKSVISTMGLVLAAIGPVLIIIGKLSIGIGVLSGGLAKAIPFIKGFTLSIRSLAAATGIGLLLVAISIAVDKISSMREQLGSFGVVFQVIDLQIKKFALEIKNKFSEAGNTVANFFRRITGREEIKFKTSVDGDIAALEDQIAFVTNQAKEKARDPSNEVQIKTGINADDIVNDLNAKAPAIAAKAKPVKIPAKITLDQELSTSNSVLDGAQAANQGRLLDAQLQGASEQSLNQIRLQGLQDYQATLQLVLQDQEALNASQSDPRITDSINRIKQGLVDTGSEIDGLTTKLTTVPSAFDGVRTSFESFRQQADSGLQNLTSLGLNGLTNALASVVDGTKTAAEAFKSFADSIIKELIKIGIQKALVAAIDGLFPGSSGSSSTGSTPGRVGADGGLIPGFNTGGRVRGKGGPRSDSILARLSNGEFVIKASSVQDLGVPFLNAINKRGGSGLSDFMKGKISNNVSAARNKSSQTKAKILNFQDGGLAEGQRAQAMPNLTINIENKSNARIQAIQPEGPSIQDQVKGLVYSIILEDAAVGGPLTRGR